MTHHNMQIDKFPGTGLFQKGMTGMVTIGLLSKSSKNGQRIFRFKDIFWGCKNTELQELVIYDLIKKA